MKKLITLLICATFIPSAFASQNKLSTTFEAGQRSLTDTAEDRDLSGNLDFYRYRLRLDQKISESINYNLSYARYHKDYETSDSLDFTSDAWHFGIKSALGKMAEGAARLSLDMGFSDKDYKNSPSLGYNRSNMTIGLSRKHEELWALNWDNGFINYDYTKSGNDQLKIFTKLSGWAKFFEERLKIGPSYKFQNVDERDSKDRTENTVSASSYYKLNFPHFDKLSGFYSFGRNDTKDSEDEDRDDDLKFKYTRWHVKTYHALSENLDTSFKYGQIRRDYQNSDKDYRTWYIENKTCFEIYEDKARKIDFSIAVGHREGYFKFTDSLNYLKNTIVNSLSYKLKNNWELSPGFTFKKYDYTASPEKNETKYTAALELAKTLCDRNLGLNLSYNYTWKKYAHKTNIELWSIKAGFEYKF